MKKHMSDILPGDVIESMGLTVSGITREPSFYRVEWQGGGFTTYSLMARLTVNA